MDNKYDIANYLLEIDTGVPQKPGQIKNQTTPKQNVNKPKVPTKTPTTSAAKPQKKEPIVKTTPTTPKLFSPDQLGKQFIKFSPQKKAMYMEILSDTYRGQDKELKKLERIYGNNIPLLIHALLTNAGVQKVEYKGMDELIEIFKKEYTKLKNVDLESIENVDLPQKDEVNPEDQKEPEVKEWKKYEDFRKEMYHATVQLKWPAKIKVDPRAPKNNDDALKSPDELWAGIGKVPFVFSSWTPDFFQKTTKNIKTYLMDTFKSDLPGLKKLSSKVNDIVEHEKEHFKGGKLQMAKNVLSVVAKFIYTGLGGNERDLKFLQIINAGRKRMTIFEYQQMVIGDVMARMNITDTTADVLKRTLQSIYSTTHKAVDETLKNGVIEPIKTSMGGSWGEEIIAYFLVKPKTQIRKEEDVWNLMFSLIAGVTEPTKAAAHNFIPSGVLAMMSKNAVKSQNFTSGQSIEKLTEMCRAYANSHSRERFKSVINSQSKPFTFVSTNKDSKGEEVGRYIRTIKVVAKYVKFELKYVVDGQ